MKKLLLIALLFGVQVLFGQEDAAIKKSIQTFFDGMYARDTVIMQSVCIDKLVLQTVDVSSKGNKFSLEKLDVFYKQISETPKTVTFEERLLDYKIQYDAGIAQVWTPYRFYVGKSLSHSGTNAFTLVKVNGVWKISYIIDTRTIAEMK